MSQHGVPERLSNMSKGFQEDGAGGSTMELLVETLTGTAFEMTVSPSDTILAIKSKIFRVEGIPISQQHLLYNLRELEDSCSLRSLKIGGGARLRLVLGMRGGPVSTRRLPPPAHSSHSYFDSEYHCRDDGEWGSAGSGCKVVLVFREGDKLNVLRVRDDQRVYSSSLPQLAPAETESTVGALRDNAVTMNKMLELRRRMRSRRSDHGEKAEIQKTRSEEILSVPSLLDDSSDSYKTYMHYNEAEDTFAPLYDGNYTRYDYDCSFSDRYTLLPPIGTRADSIQSVQDADLKLTDSLAGSILVKGRDDDAAILEEIDTEAIDECHLRQDSPQLSAQNLTPISAAEYESSAGCSDWWVSGARSPLAAAILSASTSRLDRLPRGRILPALSRHRNREHLHLSDEGLDLAPRPRNLEVGSERRQRRIENIAQISMAEQTSLFNFHDLSEELNKQGDTTPIVTTEKEKKIRIRCGFCKKKLTIATVHKCRCGAEFCAPHRYAEVHGCAYDYKANAHQYLQRANPLISAPKLPKI